MTQQNSKFRPKYKTLTVQQQEAVDGIKAKAEELDALIYRAGTLGTLREAALAATKLEECVMWAVKAVTA